MSFNFVPDWMPSTCAYVRFMKGLPPATSDEIEQSYPWGSVVSEKDLITFKVEDYELI